jgi:outer membrane autotransporter protein
MNRVYHLVWNGALRVVQVASELASSNRGGMAGSETIGPRRRPLWTALLAAGLCGFASSALSQVCTVADSTACSAQGGGSALGFDRSGDGGAGNGQGGGSRDIEASGFPAIPGDVAVNGAGGHGANGIVSGGPAGEGGTGGTVGDPTTPPTVTGGRGGDGAISAFAAGGGGGGGAAAYLPGGFILQFSGTFTGGAGGNGGAPTHDSGVGGGGGGGGGAGVIGAGDGVQVTVLAGGSLTAGAGGAGGSGDIGVQSFGGGGGGGGDGAILFGANSSIENNGAIAGGAGGAGGVGDNENGGGGEGGAGVRAVGSQITITNAVGGTIVGGAGGEGGTNGTQNAAAGTAGAGIRALADHLTVSNSGSISGGAGGLDGMAGIGIVTQGSGNIQNSGTIEGGLRTDGARDSAILFNGANNVLSLQTGSVINGAVEVANGSDAQVLAVADGSVGSVKLDGSTAIVDLSPGSSVPANLAIGSVTGTGMVTSSTGGGDLSLRDIDIIGSIALDHSGTTTLADILHTTGSQRYGTSVLLGGDTSVLSDNGPVTFASIIDGAHNLTVQAGGVLDFQDGIGVGTRLAGLDATAQSLTIGAVNAGSLHLNVVSNIAQSGAFHVFGASQFESNGDITLTNAGNTFTGGVQLTGKKINVTAGGNLAISALSAGSDVTVHSVGQLSLPASISSPSSLDLSSGAGATFLTNDMSAGSITLHSGGNLQLQGDVTANSTLTVNAPSGSVLQASGIVTTDTLAGTVAGDLSLTNPGNAIANLGALSTAFLSLVNAQRLTVAGTVHASQKVTFEVPQGVVVAGTLRVDGDLASGMGVQVNPDTSLTVGTGSTSGTLDANVFVYGGLTFLRADDVTFAGGITGDGSIVQSGTGRLLYDGDGSLFSGITTVNSGGLVVGSTAGSSASLGGTVNVEHASLGGHGTIDGDVNMHADSTLSPGNSAGTLTVSGDLTMDQGATFDAEFGAAGVGDKVIVGRNLVLNGVTLNVADVGGMGPGVYNLFAYSGALTETNGGIQFGTTPNGRLVQLQTLLGDKRINLIDYSNATLTYWNANGLASPSQSGGGDGTWSVTSPTWTDQQGSITGQMTPQPGFAIFGGAMGTVTIDDTDGSVATTGMQFQSDGYVLTGDPLALSGSGTGVVIRVGDGSAAGSGYTAIIDAALTGVAGLIKNDAGTLVLNGINTFSGGLAIGGGTVAAGDDRNLGDATNAVALEGGSLRVTGTAYTSTDRALSLVSSGAIDIADASNVFTWNGAISGVGSIEKRGAGTLAIDRANAYSGPTLVSGGTLRLGESGAIGSGELSLLDGTTLALAADGISVVNSVNVAGQATVDVDASDTAQLAGNVADGVSAGTLTKAGTGTLVLSGANSHTGGTVLAAGALRLANNAAAGTGGLSLHDGTTLALDDGLDIGNAIDVTGSSTVDVAGTAAIRGDIADGTSAGSLTKTGAGTLSLLGAATYTGPTTIAGGTLRVGDGGTTGSLPQAIVNHGTLELDRSDDVEYAGTLSGEGAFHKLGSNGLHLTGDSSAFTGTSTIDGGTLRLDGALGGTLQLASGVVVTGNGKAGSASFASGSELSPGGSGAIGALGFSGDLTMAAGSRYTVDASNTGQGDAVTVGGKATLQGGSVVSLGAGADWSTSTTYTILSAAGGVAGTFADVSTNLAFLTPSLAYTTNAVQLTLSRNEVAFPDVAQTRNQRASAGAVESLGAGVPLYDTVLHLDAVGARTAFDALSGEIHANLRGAITDDDRYQRDAINQHLLTQYSDGTDGATAAWASAWGHWGNHDGDGNAARLRANGGGMLVGADTGVGTDTRLGFALGTGHVSASARGDSADGDTRTAGLYGSGHYGNVLLQAGALYSHRDIDTHRTVAAGELQQRLAGNMRARSAQLFVEGAYDFRFDHGSLAPFLNLARQELRTNSLHEHGGDAALDVQGDKSAQTFGTLGLRGQWDLSAEGRIGLFGSMGWQHAWGDTDSLSRQRFAAGGDAFQVAGTPIAENAGVATFGLRFQPAPAVTIDASYSGQFASDAKDQSARLSLNWAF